MTRAVVVIGMHAAGDRPMEMSAVHPVPFITRIDPAAAARGLVEQHLGIMLLGTSM